MRTGRKGGRAEEEEEEKSGRGKNRRSRDKKVNEEGRKLIDFIEKIKWSMCNSNIRKDEEGEYIYIQKAEHLWL